MTQIIDNIASMTALAMLASSAARALALAALAALGLAAFRVKTTSLRLFTWTAVLYAALAMPFLGRLLPPLSVPTPGFLQSNLARPLFSDISDSRTLAPEASPSARTDFAVSHVRVAAKVSEHDSSSPMPPHTAHDTSQLARQSTSAWHFRSRWLPIRGSAVAALLYLAVTLILFARVFVGIVFSRRLVRASRTIHDPSVAERITSHASALASVPQIAESDLISVPVTVGALRSTILFPAVWRDWDDATLDAVIAHEVSHVARGDALTQRLSLLHRAIFWFSPLAWWLDRHLAGLAEQASDEAALTCGADRNDYARTLLGFFEALHTSPGRVWWQGVSMAKAGQAEQRLERILAWRGAVTMSLQKSIAVAIIAFALPVVYLAASVRPAHHSQSSSDVLALTQEQTPPAAPKSPLKPPSAASAPSAPSLPAAPTGGIVSESGPAPVAPPALVAPVAAVAPVPPPAAWSGQSHGSGKGYGHGYSYSYGYDDDQRFVIVTGKSDSLTMSGTSEDARHVEKLRKQIPGDFIWFQRDEKSYIIRDQATIDRARKLWAPQEELGKKQEELGRKQEALGKQQEELGSRMEQVRVNVPDMTEALDKLKAKLQKLGPSATMEQIGDLQSEIGVLQSKIGEIQSQAGEQQSKLGELQGALGEKQGKLGEEQGELGRQQGELAEKATIQMKGLLDEAIKNGKAQPEPDAGSGASL
jgi:beta-lactamase regulating signal transducer with metallopeptidase domain